MITRYLSYIKEALWTLITLSTKLNSIETQLKIANNVHNHQFEFYYDDLKIALFLPLVGFDVIQNTIVSTGTFFEAPLLKVASRYIKRDAFVADCGCNIGNHSVFFAKVCHACHVISFDPQPLCAAACKRNMELNGVSNISTVIQKALGKEIGYANLAQEIPGNCGMTRYKVDDIGSIPMITIDSLNLSQLDFMKIDIEGGQLDLLIGAQATIKKCHPTIWIELLSDDGSPDYDFKKEVELPQKMLKEFGYNSIQTIGKDNYIFSYSA